MNAIVPVVAVAGGQFEFTFEGKVIRGLLGYDTKRRFVSKDVAEALGYRDAANLNRVVRPRERGTHQVSTLGGAQSMSTVTEPGLYWAIMQRKLLADKDPVKRATVERFQDWVVEEVLPTIRRTGSYGPAPTPAPATAFAQADLLNPDVLLPLLTAYAQGNVALKAELVIERQAHGATTSALADAHVRADLDRPKVIAQERQALADGELGLSEAAVALGVDRIRVVDHLIQIGFLVRGVDGRCRSTREGRRSGLVRQTVGTRERMDGTEILRGSVVVTATGYTHLAELFCRGAAAAGQPALPGL